MRLMEFDFVIGKEEKHKVRFSYSNFWGTKHVEVDNRSVKKRAITAFLYLLVFLFIVVLASYRYTYLWRPEDVTGPVPGIVEIFLFFVILVIIVMVVDLLPISVTVGENEKHEVRIQKLIFWGYPWLRIAFRVYVDGISIGTVDG
ncbi:MAG: hypothetical protein ACFFD4_09615 [Candidatus Odinarchaeota archaeon]